MSNLVLETEDNVRIKAYNDKMIVWNAKSVAVYKDLVNKSQFNVKVEEQYSIKDCHCNGNDITLLIQD